MQLIEQTLFLASEQLPFLVFQFFLLYRAVVNRLPAAIVSAQIVFAALSEKQYVRTNLQLDSSMSFVAELTLPAAEHEGREHEKH